MSNPGQAPLKPEPETEKEPQQGPSLLLLYGLIAVALIAAIGFALLIVLPFYNRR